MTSESTSGIQISIKTEFKLTSCAQTNLKLDLDDVTITTAVGRMQYSSSDSRCNTSMSVAAAVTTYPGSSSILTAMTTPKKKF